MDSIRFNRNEWRLIVHGCLIEDGEKGMGNRESWGLGAFMMNMVWWLWWLIGGILVFFWKFEFLDCWRDFMDGEIEVEFWWWLVKW